MNNILEIRACSPTVPYDKLSESWTEQHNRVLTFVFRRNVLVLNKMNGYNCWCPWLTISQDRGTESELHSAA